MIRSMSEHILVVEDEPSIAEVVSLYLKRAGFTVETAGDGDEAKSHFDKHQPEFIILDLMLPGVEGLSLLRWFRDRSSIPIIVLTARREEMDRIAGLESGADDYVVKPFSPQELVSRVRAVLRRVNREDSTPSGDRPVIHGSLVIDPGSRTLTLAGKAIPLTVKEFDLLHLLALNPRQVYTRDQLLERIWGGADYIDAGTVTVHIRRLREKIETDPSAPKLLLTVWGVGYKFEP